MKGSIFLLLVQLTSFYAGGVLSVGDDAYSVTITTDPSQGPFRVDQHVQFSCLVEPTPPDPVSYQWRAVEDVYGGNSYSRQSFNRTYYISDLQYCWYFCQVFINQTLIGSSSKLVEVLGFMYTEEPVVRSFHHGGRIHLNVIISGRYYARFITSLAWYHNGTQITSGNKFTITNSYTRLIISDMDKPDAGLYQVKINSISYYGDNSSTCDSLVLPLLEPFAIHAPVSFLVQDNTLPVYDPHSVISTQYIRKNSLSIRLMRAVQNTTFTSGGHGSLSVSWYRNGVGVTDSSMYNQNITSEDGLTAYHLEIISNETEYISGKYVGILMSSDLYFTLQSTCWNYYRYLDDISFSLVYTLPLEVSYWNIRTVLSVLLHFERSALSQLESTAVECTAIGGEPAEIFNLTLWRNGELLASANGAHLRYNTTPYSYGTYRCAVDDVHNTAILQERAHFQLLLGDISYTRCENLMDQHIEDLKMSISDTLSNLCQSCADVYTNNIVDTQLNCSASGKFAYFTAGLVYSDPDGRITASTLVNMLLIWLLTQETPSLVVNDFALALNKQCLTQLNTVTENACIALYNSEPFQAATTTQAAATAQFSGALLAVVGFFAGLVSGIVITVTAIAVILCLRKLRASRVQAGDSQQPEKDIAMDPNPYEPMDVRYQAASGGQIQAEDEAIYELPAV